MKFVDLLLVALELLQKPVLVRLVTVRAHQICLRFVCFCNKSTQVLENSNAPERYFEEALLYYQNLSQRKYELGISPFGGLFCLLTGRQQPQRVPSQD